MRKLEMGARIAIAPHAIEFGRRDEQFEGFTKAFARERQAPSTSKGV
jgi:hypothetical protein